MRDFGLVYPMFAMVILTFVVLVALFVARTRSVRNGTVSGVYFKTYQGETEPTSSVQLSRHFANIFEAPVLFYVACLAAMIGGQASIIFEILAWTYVALRTMHAYIHTRSNKLRPRIAVYFFSWTVLLLMWVYLAISAAAWN